MPRPSLNFFLQISRFTQSTCMRVSSILREKNKQKSIQHEFNNTGSLVLIDRVYDSELVPCSIKSVCINAVVVVDHHCFPPGPWLPPRCTASSALGQYQIILLGERRHTGVNNLPKVRLSVSTYGLHIDVHIYTAEQKKTAPFKFCSNCDNFLY